MDDKFTAQQLERRCRELEDAVRVEKMKNSGSEITRKRLQKRLNNTQSETADYKSQMEYLLSMKEKLESSVKKYETAASQGDHEKNYLKQNLLVQLKIGLMIQHDE